MASRRLIGVFLILGLMSISNIQSFAIIEIEIFANTNMTLDVRQPLEKTPFLERFEEMEKEVSYSEFYQDFDPSNDKEYLQKFKQFVQKLHDANQKYGYPDSFDLDGILNSSELNDEYLIPMGGGNANNGRAINYHNGMSPGWFKNGDIVLATNPGWHPQGRIEHAGLMDKSRYNEGDPTEACFHSAQSGIGVIYEDLTVYEGRRECWQISVITTQENRDFAVRQAALDAPEGKQYLWSASKNDLDRWYCSKIPWHGYYRAVGIDIDANGGYHVLPEDILNSGHVAIWHHWEDIDK